MTKRLLFLLPALVALVFLTVGLFSIYPFDLFRLNGREIDVLPADLVAAQARWKAHPVKHYRFTVKYSGKWWSDANYTECIHDVEVTDEQVTTVFADSCQKLGSYVQKYFIAPDATVTNLFAKVSHDATTIQFGHDQACGDLLVVTATYDATIGYPTSAAYDYEQVSPRNLGPETYRRLYGIAPVGSRCLTIFPPIPPTITTTLQPLP